MEKSIHRNNHLTGFRCLRCHMEYLPGDVRYTCPKCSGNLDAQYDYDRIRKVISTASLKSNSEPSIWRYRPFLPLQLSGPPVNLKIGMTPLTRGSNLGHQMGLKNLFIKNDGLNPSGSLKDRASFVVLAHCIGQGIKQVSIASTGNAGSSMACLAAAAQMEAFIFVPEKTPRPKMAQLLLHGAKVIFVRGDYGEAFELCEQASEAFHWFNRSSGINPYTREGKKTVSFEIWEQMDFDVPDCVIVSVGDGNIISGVYKGFYDLLKTGFIDRLPRLVGVQPTGSASITNAFHGDGVIRSIKPDTIADSISISRPSDGEAALRAVKNTKGTMTAVDDSRILASVRSLAEKEGIFAEPSGAACFAGLEALVEEKIIAPEDKVVLIVTGNGLKDVESAFKVAGHGITVDPNIEAVMKVFTDGS